MKAQLIDWLLPCSLIAATAAASADALGLAAAAVAVFAVCGWLYVRRGART